MLRIGEWVKLFDGRLAHIIGFNDSNHDSVTLEIPCTGGAKCFSYWTVAELEENLARAAAEQAIQEGQ